MNSWILKYYEEIKLGNIVVGKELMMQLEKCVKEIRDPIYQSVMNIKIDFSLSEKRITFIEKECKLYQAPYAGKPFKLELFQKWIMEAIYAILWWDDELQKYVRKYQDILLLEGRKNGKTPFIAAQSLSEWFCGPIGGNILYASNSYEQAALMFDAADAMREESRTLEKVTHKNQHGIFFGNQKQKKKKGKFSKQNKGSIKKLSAKTGAKEGKNITEGAVDEVHEMKDNSLVAPVRQALSTQDEPLYFEITTEGFTDDGYLDKRLIDARKVLKGEVENERWLIILYTQDSEAEVWQDEESWQKSNPAIGIFKKYSFLRKMIEEAKNSTATRAFVLAKDFNIKQNSAAAWLKEEDIINLETFELEQFRGFYYIGGIDYSETTDLCNAKALFVDPQTKKKYSLSMYFIPEIKANEDALNPEGKDYKGLSQKGIVTICPGDENDAKIVADWFYGLYTDYEMIPYKIGYDNWHIKELKKRLIEYFGEDILERIGMDSVSLSNPMGLVESDLKYNNLIYNNNELDIWCLKNTAIKVDNIGRIMPVKVERQAKNRIDGALGFIIAYATLSRFRSEYMAMIS